MASSLQASIPVCLSHTVQIEDMYIYQCLIRWLVIYVSIAVKSLYNHTHVHKIIHEYPDTYIIYIYICISVYRRILVKKKAHFIYLQA